MKRLISLILFAIAFCIGAFATDTVYINGVGGSDTNSGTRNAPFATLQKAFEALANGGKAVVIGDVTLANNETLSANQNITVSCENGAKISISSNLYIDADVTFENVNLNCIADIPMIFCEGNNVTFGNGITTAYTKYAPIIYGGTYGGKSGITQAKMCFADYTVTVKSGTWYYIRGGNYRDSDAQAVGTLSNVTLNILGGTFTSNKMGASDNAVISPLGFDALLGDATLNISGGTFKCSIVGVGRPGYNASVSNNQFAHGNIFINITGGTFDGGDIRAVQDSVASEINGDFFVSVSGGTFKNFGTVDASCVNGLAIADLISSIESVGFSPIFDLNDGDGVTVTNGALIRVNGTVGSEALKISGDKKVIIKGTCDDAAIDFSDTLYLGTDTVIENIALIGYGTKVISCSDGKIRIGEGISGNGVALKNFTDAKIESGLFAYMKGARDKDVTLHIDGATVTGDIIASSGDSKANGQVLITSGTFGGNIYAFENCGKDGAVQILGGTHTGKIGAAKHASDKCVDTFGAYSVCDSEIDFAGTVKYNTNSDAVFVTNALNLAKGQIKGDGTSPLTPMTDLSAAITAANGEKTVVICGPVYLKSTTVLPIVTKKTVITSKYMGTDYRDFADARIELSLGLRISSETVFENVTFLAVEKYTFVSAEGNRLTVGDGVECEIYRGKRIEQYPSLVGGTHAKTTSIKGVDLTVKSGTWGILSGGSYYTSDTDTKAYKVSGKINVTVLGGTFKNGVYLAGRGSIGADASLNILGGTFACPIYGTYNSNTTGAGNLYIYIEGGTFQGDIGRAKDRSAWGRSFTLDLVGGNFDRVSSILPAGGNLNVASGIDLDREIVGQATFQNPIAGYADPSVVYYGGYYYYTFAKSYLSKPAIYMAKAANLCDIGKVEPFIVWSQALSDDGADIEDVWAPQLFLIDGVWYIYTTCDVGIASDVSSRRMPRIWRASTSSPDGGYEYVGTFKNLDGAVESYLSPRIIHHGSKMYMVCGGFFRAEDCTNQHLQRLFICELSDATTMATPMAVISTPEYDYEAGIMEGPFPITSPNGTLYLIFAAGHTRTDEYCTGVMRFNGTESDSLLDGTKWEKFAQPLQFASYENGVYSPGAMVITTTPSGDEYLAVYHAKEYHYSAYTMRRMYMQKLTFVNGFPTIGDPLPTATEFSVELNKLPLANRISDAGSIGVATPKNFGPYYSETVYASNLPLGDANSDGENTLIDALRALKFIAGEKLSGFDFVHCDFDKNGCLDVFDVLNILKIVLAK